MFVVSTEYIPRFFSFIRFNKISGKYKAYSYEENENPKEAKYDILKNETNGTAKIKYLGGNKFNIEVKERLNSKNVWKGQILFENINTASLSWHYISPQSLKDVVGLKN